MSKGSKMGSEMGSRRRRLRPGDQFRATVMVDDVVKANNQVFKYGQKCSKTNCVAVDPKSSTGRQLRGRKPGHEFSWKEMDKGVLRTITVTIHEIMEPSENTATMPKATVVA